MLARISYRCRWYFSSGKRSESRSQVMLSPFDATSPFVESPYILFSSNIFFQSHTTSDLNRAHRDARREKETSKDSIFLSSSSFCLKHLPLTAISFFSPSSFPCYPCVPFFNTIEEEEETVHLKCRIVRKFRRLALDMNTGVSSFSCSSKR